jgi:polysaccharide export outer membrane protein
VARAAANDDTLGADDVFEVRVFEEEELTGTYRVAYDGTIDFPLVGRVAVAGLTPPQVGELLVARLRDGQFLLRPQVSVLVKEYNSRRISIFGQVQRPGTFPFQDSMDIVHAITLSGGFTPLADENATTVTRRRGTRERRFRIPVQSIGQGQADNFYLEPGDTVYVPENPL